MDERTPAMKKIVFSFLCAILAFTLTAEDQVDLDKQLAELEKERARLQTLLIQQRRNAIRNDKYAAKLAREILTLNQQLSEYLDTKQDIKPLNNKLADIDRQIKDLKQAQKNQKAPVRKPTNKNTK